jgi:hypothetical protein
VSLLELLYADKRMTLPNLYFDSHGAMTAVRSGNHLSEDVSDPLSPGRTADLDTSQVIPNNRNLELRAAMQEAV